MNRPPKTEFYPGALNLCLDFLNGKSLHDIWNELDMYDFSSAKNFDAEQYANYLEHLKSLYAEYHGIPVEYVTLKKKFGGFVTLYVHPNRKLPEQEPVGQVYANGVY